MNGIKQGWHETEYFKTYIFGGDLSLIHFLAIFMTIDIITGLSKAIKNKNLWSRKSLFGFARKILIFLVIIMSNLIDTLLNMEGVLLLGTVMFYIGNEILSIFENLAQLGMPLPKKLQDTLAVIQETDRASDYVTTPKEKDDKHG